MALDHALARGLPPGEGVVRFYSWEPPTVSFGRNEPTAGRYRRDLAEARGIGFVRRPTGGRAVFHHREITYSVTCALGALGGLREAYGVINRGLVEGLRSLGVAVESVRDGVVVTPDAGPCFQTPAPGEVVADGRKLVGSAQVRVDGALLQHGSVILAGDQTILDDLAVEEGPPAPPPASLAALLGRLDVGEVREALVAGLNLALGGAWYEGGYSPHELDTAEILEEERYALDTWTWRR
ncbi:MAG: lipoate--protein ligase family protein [Gemmatimonadota bacterium]|nr:lipoate--protein ligase family protein [Gemmatimonadota bacterium]